MNFFRRNRSPLGLRWRAGYPYVTFVVWLGIAVDLLVYSLVIPVMPFRLEHLGYKDPSSYTGWLLFSYSIGSAIATFPVAMISERYNARQWPLILGVFCVAGSLTLLMEARVFWLMVIGRVLQGVGSAMVWVAGLALLCDTSPEKIVGRQLGIATAGMGIGFLLGPPVSGALYQRFGFRGPCVFGIIAAATDLIARIFVIERKDSIKYGFDPHHIAPEENSSAIELTEGKKDGHVSDSNTESDVKTAEKAPPLSLPAVLLKLMKSKRAVATIFCLFVYGAINTAFEPALPVHMHQIWNFDSEKVGLIFLAAIVASLPSSVISGFLTDKIGTGPITTAALVLSCPFWVVLIIRKLGIFITCFALQFFFITAAVPPLTAELADVARTEDGIGFAHVYGAFNLAYGLGATVGPIMGGQIYDHVHKGWTVLCLVALVWLGIASFVSFFFIGETPMYQHFVRIRTMKHSQEEETHAIPSSSPLPVPVPSP